MQWEKITPTYEAPLDETLMTQYDAVIAHITSVPTQYAVIVITSKKQLMEYNKETWRPWYPILNQTLERRSEAFIDVWTRLATRYKNMPNMIFELASKPFMDFTAQTWMEQANKALLAIRGAGATSQMIIVPSVGNSMVEDFYSQHNKGMPPSDVMQDIVDPADNYVLGFEVHHDHWNSGWDECGAFLNWWTNANSWQCRAVMKRVLNFLALNNDVWIGAAYGGPKYWGLTVEPANVDILINFAKKTQAEDRANLRYDAGAIDSDGRPNDMLMGAKTTDYNSGRWDDTMPMQYRIEHVDSPPEVLDTPVVVWDYTGNQYDPANDVLLGAMMDFVSHNNGSVAFAYYRITIGKDHKLDGSYEYAPKPDVVIESFSTISYRYGNNDTLPLTSYFQEFSEQTGKSFPDRFIKQASYQYKFSGEWHAVPFNTDMLYMLINVKTFKDLNIPLPPPLSGGLSKAEWTWPRFVETVQKLSQAGVFVPFWMSLGTNKDDYHLSNIARTYGTGLIDIHTDCTLTSPRWIQAFNDIVAPLFMPPNNATFLPWQLSTIGDIQKMPFIEDPLKFPDLTFSYDDDYNGFGSKNGIWFDTANRVKKEEIWNTDPTKWNTALALYPGDYTWLGGAGLFINRNATHPHIAWKFLTWLADYEKHDYQLMLAYFGNNPSAYDEVAADERLGQRYPAFYEVVNMQAKWAVPQRYPLPNLPVEFSILDKCPIRMLLAETLVQGIPIELATKRACAAVKEFMLHVCGDRDLKLVSRGCGDSRDEIWDWVFAQLDQDGDKLCRVDPLVVIPRAMLTSVFATLSVGPPTKGKCISKIWVVVLGLALLLGGLVVKLTRIHTVLTYGKIARKGTDLASLSWLTVIVLGDLVLLLIWSFWNNPGTEVNIRVVPDVVNGEYAWVDCSNGFTVTVAGLMVGNSIFIIYGLWYTLNIHIRHKPTVIIRSLTANTILLTLYPIIGLAVGDRIDNPGSRGGFQAGLILLGGVGSVLIYLLPKVFTLDQEEDKLDNAAQNSLCPTCHGTGKYGGLGSNSALAINEKNRKSISSPENDELLKPTDKTGGNVSIAMIESKPMADFEDRIEKGKGEGGVG
ncbi:hypothetical protein HK097_009272 [Rhizophlyctis rosea]|uniref:cellulase n=1 Tax=Rhizophlyctis rosea TaxID=64517 RepID=A0AAD5X5B1_9FUNG|nr:hypothetical protein HK097_009272 [Rhizophlyctis rosea]